MAVMTVPVTSGGKKRTTLDMNGAMSMPKNPAAMVAPKIPCRPIPGMPAMATMLPTAAKLAPIITGMRMPIGPMPKRLDDGGDPGDQQVGVDQKGDFFTTQPSGLSDDQRHGDGAAVHQQNMLQADQDQLQKGKR